MPKFLSKRWYGFHIILAFAYGLLAAGLLAFFIRWYAGLAGLLVLLIMLFFTVRNQRAAEDELESYIQTLTHRIKKASDEVINRMPIGILLLDQERKIEWYNPLIQQMTEDNELIGKHLLDVFPPLADVTEETQKAEITYKNRIYQVLFRPEERLLYFTDITDYKELLMHYNEGKLVLAIVYLDNLDEVAQGLDEQVRSMLLTNVTGLITKWAHKYDIYLKRMSSDKFIAVLDEGTLHQLEETRFDILDQVREMTGKNKVPLTLSIGVGAGRDMFIELGEMAQSSLDVALGRGGDQAAIKNGDKLTFYGGKSNAVEKRNRVRARVISHALRDLILESDHILIMGHRMPDMDAIGAAIGVLKAVHANEKEGYILLDESNPAIERLIQEVEEHEMLGHYFITSEQAVQMVTRRTLVVVVDTHRPSMVIEPRLLTSTSKVVLIDHHRRSADEFISDPVLIYLEPYASSTSELVTELLQYQNEKLSMDVLEATALLAGIVVDTKSFAFRTGSRTFEAASFLRRKGADTNLLQTLLKEDLDQYIRRSEILQNTQVYQSIAIARGKDGQTYGQLLIAQAADTLLTMAGIEAAFVVCKRPDEMIGISARSLGDFNVQLIMEKLGGGGHINNAATQIKNSTVDEAVAQLKEIIFNNQGGKQK